MARRQVGLVGCGRWGSLILRDLRELGCEVPVVTRSKESVAAARDGGAASVSATVDELPEVDGIVVATPTSTHAEIAEQALARGVPVFVEKPLCADAAKAERLAASANGRLFVMDKWRYHPGVELLGELARSGELGAVIGLRATRVGWGKPHLDVDAIWVLAPHDLSIALEVLGELPRALSAVADLDGSGLVGILGESPWLALEVSSRSPERRREVILTCEAGVAVLSGGYSNRVLIHRDDGIEKRVISTDLPLLRELRAFVEHLDGGPPPRSSAAEAAAIVRTISELRELAGLPA